MRMSVITEIVALGKDNVETIANCFAKHGEKVCKKYYIQAFSERSAARISWDCYSLYKSQDNLKAAAAIRTKKLKTASLPTVSKIKNWIEEAVSRIRIDSNTNVEDKNLMKELQKLQTEEGIFEVEAMLSVNI